ncbi:MAG: trypsin-like peptidase domain-containing protein [Acidimicrobiia bacterium]|nr:trypsin-like peptidase domain-containing protein [Acidimicrobiia bacterium]
MPLFGPDEAADDDLRWSFPPPPDDRLWRHPSEVSVLAEPKPPRRWRLLVVALGGGLAGGALVVAVLALFGLLASDDRRSVPAVTREAARPLSSLAAAGSDVRNAEQVRPAIARVEVEGDVNASGSAVLFRTDGHLLTNAHVVEGADRIIVVLADGTERQAELIGADATTDIAVLRIGAGEPFPAAVLGRAADLRVGQPVVAIGSPLGLLGGSSVTTGVVSALGREVDGDDGPLLDMVQTDAAISPGSSGGALLDGSGAVIGITTAIAVSDVGAEGLGFATPVELARSVGEEIITTGRAVHVWLGVRGADADGGALVEEVLADSPAAESGLQERDVVVAVDGEAVASMSALVIALRDRDPGEVVELDVRSGGDRRRVSVALEERPDS